MICDTLNQPETNCEFNSKCSESRNRISVFIQFDFFAKCVMILLSDRDPHCFDSSSVIDMELI